MRFGIAAAAAASAAMLMDVAEASYSNKYLDKHVYAKKMALEAKYGKGLYGMYDENGRFNKESLVTQHSYYKALMVPSSQLSSSRLVLSRLMAWVPRLTLSV